MLQHQQCFNEAAIQWGRTTTTQFLYQLRVLPFKERVMWAGRDREDILRDKVSIGFKKIYGDVVRIKWTFARHGIFQERGVGRGHKKGSDKEKPMPWIVKTLDAQVSMLANTSQEEDTKRLGLVIRTKVNGLFNIELK
jgi:hypothetical protein